MLRAVALLLLLTTPAHAFNALGHKVIADIAWQQLDDASRGRIVKTLRRHPRFDSDFAQKMPADVAETDRWIFQHAATWPDLIRGQREYDHPTWHYVNFPYYIDGQPAPPGLNLSALYPTRLDMDKCNVAQAVKHCQATLKGDASPGGKALAYCWLFHLVGDLHQPLHSTALVCERFPNGDRGGNSIPTVQGRNLHALWDNLLGRQHRPNDVKREVAELRQRPTHWKVDPTGGVEAWIQESHELAKAFVYSAEILEAVKRPGELPPIHLPRAYLEKAGDHARARVVAAGLRLASLLKQ